MNVLSTKTFPFPRRLAALEHIRHILGDAAQVAALRDAAEWRQLRKDLVVSLALQITDLRSNVVRRSSLALVRSAAPTRCLPCVLLSMRCLLVCVC